MEIFEKPTAHISSSVSCFNFIDSEEKMIDLIENSLSFFTSSEFAENHFAVTNKKKKLSDDKLSLTSSKKMEGTTVSVLLDDNPTLREKSVHNNSLNLTSVSDSTSSLSSLIHEVDEEGVDVFYEKEIVMVSSSSDNKQTTVMMDNDFPRPTFSDVPFLDRHYALILQNTTRQRCVHFSCSDVTQNSFNMPCEASFKKECCSFFNDEDVDDDGDVLKSEYESNCFASSSSSSSSTASSSTTSSSNKTLQTITTQQTDGSVIDRKTIRLNLLGGAAVDTTEANKTNICGSSIDINKQLPPPPTAQHRKIALLHNNGNRNVSSIIGNNPLGLGSRGHYYSHHNNNPAKTSLFHKRLQLNCGGGYNLNAHNKHSFNSHSRNQNHHNNVGISNNNNTSRRLTLLPFIHQLLQPQSQAQDCIHWVNKDEAIFSISNLDKLTQRWGIYKNNSRRDNQSLNRALRTYYKKRPGLERIETMKHTYKFV